MACVVVIFLAFAIVVGVPILIITLVTKSLIRKPSIANSQGEFNEQKWKFKMSNEDALSSIERYIYDSRAAKISDEKIKKVLVDNGWLEGDIDIAFNKFAGLNQ